MFFFNLKITTIRKLLFFFFLKKYTTCKKNKDQMKNLDCNQINIFINLEIIGEKKLYIYFS